MGIRLFFDPSATRCVGTLRERLEETLEACGSAWSRWRPMRAALSLLSRGPVRSQGAPPRLSELIEIAASVADTSMSSAPPPGDGWLPCPCRRWRGDRCQDHLGLPPGSLRPPSVVRPNARHSSGMWWSEQGRESGPSHVDPAWVCHVLQRPPQQQASQWRRRAAAASPGLGPRNDKPAE